MGRIAIGIKAAFCIVYGKLFVCLSFSYQLSALRPGPTVFSGPGSKEELGVHWLRDEYMHALMR